MTLHELPLIDSAEDRNGKLSVILESRAVTKKAGIYERLDLK